MGSRIGSIFELQTRFCVLLRTPRTIQIQQGGRTKQFASNIKILTTLRTQRRRFSSHRSSAPSSSFFGTIIVCGSPCAGTRARPTHYSLLTAPPSWFRRGADDLKILFPTRPHLSESFLRGPMAEAARPRPLALLLCAIIVPYRQALTMRPSLKARPFLVS